MASASTNSNPPGAVQYMVRDAMLTSKEAHTILANLDADKLSVRAPFRPCGGQIFVYAPDVDPREYTADGYRWSYNTSFRGYPQHNSENTLVERRTKNILTKSDPVNGDKRFRLYVYKLPCDGPTSLMVHYIGDSTLAEAMPHGREKKRPQKDWFGTAGRILTEIKSHPDSQAQELYDELRFRPEARDQHAYRPRDLKQVHNHQYLERVQNRLSHGHIYSTYLLGFELEDFVLEFRAAFQHQNNLLFMASRPLMQTLHRLLRLPRNSQLKLVDVFYDTTFRLGQFYVSTMTFRHNLLVDRPVIPFCFSFAPAQICR